jgi:hypothetical protein
VFWLALWLTATVAICVLALLPVSRVALHVKLTDAVSRVWRGFWPAPVQPVGQPIEDIAKSLRRLQQWLDSYADSRPMPGKATKVIATTNAYDRVLVEACQAPTDSIARRSGCACSRRSSTPASCCGGVAKRSVDPRYEFSSAYRTANW